MREGPTADPSEGALAAATTMSETPAIPWHQPVMVDAVLRHLNPRPGAVIVDGTAGTGGHGLAILPRLLPAGRLVAIDRDRDSLERAHQRLIEFEPMATFVHDNYRNLAQILARVGLSRVDGVLLDLGMSSLHVDSAERGFSFSKEGPLDMRMDPEQALSAQELVNTLAAEELAMMLEQFGEERFAARIARQIVHARRQQPITTTTQLARIVADALPPSARHGRVHAATRTFQALRIAVNDELGALEGCLEQLDQLLTPGGRAVILTFHSLEDRLVKHRFVEGMRSGLWTVLTKKPARPTEDEVKQNPRARSAKLRAIEQKP